MNIRKNYKKINLLLYFNYLCAMLIVLWGITPFLSRNGPEVILIAAITFWFLTAFFIRPSLNKNMLTLMGFIGLWLFWIISYRLVGFSSSAWGNYYVQILYWMIVIIYVFYKQGNFARFNKFLCYFVSFIVLINIWDNIRLLLIFPHASEYINLSYGSQYLGMNVGATSFSFLCFLLYAGALFWFFSIKKIGVRIYCLVLIISSIYYMLLSGRGTAFILLVIFTLLLINRVICNHYFRGSYIIYYILLILMLLSFFVIFPLIIFKISEFFPDNRLIIRFQDIVNMIYGSRYSGLATSGDSRLELTMLSLKTWFSSLSSFFIGIGDHKFSSIAKSMSLGIGNHAEFIDTLARYGLFGSMIFFAVMWKSLLYIKSKGTHYYWRILVLIYFVYGCVNTLTMNMEFSIVLFLFLGNVLDVELLKNIKGGTKYDSGDMRTRL